MTGLPANLASRQRRGIIDDAVSGLGMARGAHISIRGNRFRLIGANGAELLVPNPYVDVIVVDANAKSSKIYFENDYDPNADVPPTCFSDNGTGPSVQSLSPQAPTCAICPWNIVGSDQSKVTGRGIKACSDRKKLAVIIPDDPAINVYELQIPPGSLTNFRNYAKWLMQQATGQKDRMMDAADVVTRIEFDTDKMGVMKFSAVAFADDDRTLQLVEHIYANNLSDATVGRNDVAHDPENVKRLLAGQSAAALPAPAPQAAPAPTGFTLPPRAAPTPLPPPVAAAPTPALPPASSQAEGSPPTSAPRGRGRRSQQPAAPQQTAAAPFMAPAAPAGQAPMATPGNLDIPEFLKRDATNAAPSAAPAQRFGVGPAPAPPAAVQDALASAMSLPTRR